jgi:tripartite-type tricarboxylate transporter receptor subunit TctC
MPAVALAQSAATFPSRVIHVVTPVTPGGSPDVLARVIAQKLQETWGQPLVVENRPGVGGNLGAEYVSKSAPDGYTWLLAPNNVMVMNPHLISASSPAKDLAPVAMVAQTPFVLVVHSSVPANSVKELIALAKAKPGTLNFGSPGSGQPQHLGGELFNALAGTDIVHVPYRGAVPAVTDLLAGRIQVWFGSVNTLLPHIKAGKLRVLGALSSKRYRSFPDIPTVAESGVPGFDLDVWLAAMVPAGVPADIVAKIRSGLVTVLSQPDVRERLAQQGLEAAPSTTAELRALIQADYARYGKLVRDAGIKAE